MSTLDTKIDTLERLAFLLELLSAQRLSGASDSLVIGALAGACDPAHRRAVLEIVSGA